MVIKAKRLALARFMQIKESEYTFLNSKTSVIIASPQIENLINKPYKKLCDIFDETPNPKSNQHTLNANVRNKVGFMINQVVNIT